MNIKKYKILVLPQFKNEFYKIFGYSIEVSNKSKECYQIFDEILTKLKQLEYMPQLYAKTEKCDELGKIYRKIIIKQYIILYSIDEQENCIYIAHIFYKKSNYLSKL